MSPSRARRCCAVVAPGLVLVLTSGPLGSPAQAMSASALTAFDARLLHDINHARVARGLGKLTLAAGTADVAHHWSCHQAAHLTLAHNLNLAAQLVTHGSALWTTYGENVGVQSAADGADHLFRLYMNDPGHRANILSTAYRYVGLWSKRHNGRRYDTVDFVGSP